MKKLFLLAGLLLGSAVAFSQAPTRNCGTMDALQRLQTQDPSLAVRMQQIEKQTAAYLSGHSQNAVQGAIVIPVVFHILYNTAIQNISDAQCQAQINQLNLDFARLNTDRGNTPSAFASVAAITGVQFCLAVRDPSGNTTSGIERRQTSSTSFGTNDNIKHSNTGGMDAWPAGDYLNIWSGNLSGGLLGYAQFPGGPAQTDGVVVLYSSVGSMQKPGTETNYDLGRTATHEVGHWVNLYHIWGDDNGNCNGSDLVGDTPNQGSENYGCPSFPVTDACSPSSPGVMYMNYMDYTDDRCMNMFTAGQSARMNALFVSGGARVSILSSSGCVPVGGGTTCNVPGGTSTSGITTNSATLNWSPVSGAVSYTVNYRPTGAASWNVQGTSSTSMTLGSLSASTAYEWMVQTNCSSGSSNFSAVVSFTTQSVATGCTDIYESNNSSSAAKAIAVNTTINASISSSTDVDWFRFTTSKPYTRLKISLGSLPANFDLTLYNQNLSQIGISQNAGTTDESIVYNTGSTRTYYVKVTGSGGAFSSSCYALRADVSNTNWRTMAGEAVTVVTTDALSNLAVFPNPSPGRCQVQFDSGKDGAATLRVMDLAGRTLSSQQLAVTEGPNQVDLNLTGKSPGIYFVEIRTESSRMVQRFVIQ